MNEFFCQRIVIGLIVLSFDHRSFDQLNMSNHSLPARGTDPPYSHKNVVSITHEQNIICSKTLICRQLVAGHVVSSWPMKKREEIHMNDNLCSQTENLKYGINI